jgi:hypothetical protein
MNRIKTRTLTLSLIALLIWITVPAVAGAFDVAAPAYSDSWNQSVLCGYSVAEAEFDLEADGTCTLRSGLLDPGLASSRIVVY